jgi:hypothetical protein
MMTGVTFFGVALPGWVLNAAALIVWVALVGIVFRLLLRTHDRVRCPATGRMGFVTLLRGPDGGIEDVLRCSLVPKDTPFACGKRCLRTAHG